MSRLTPIEVELLRNGLTSICDEMFLAIMKSAYSTNIKERHDHSAAIFDVHGRVVVQGESLPLHLRPTYLDQLWSISYWLVFDLI